MDYSKQRPQSEIETFSSKLAEWSESLPEAQRSIAQILVEHARTLTPERVALDRVTADLKASAKAVIAALNTSIETPQGWVRIDPIWERRNQERPGEDVELIQRVFVKTRQ